MVEILELVGHLEVVKFIWLFEAVLMILRSNGFKKYLTLSVPGGSRSPITIFAFSLFHCMMANRRWVHVTTLWRICKRSNSSGCLSSYLRLFISCWIRIFFIHIDWTKSIFHIQKPEAFINTIIFLSSTL